MNTREALHKMIDGEWATRGTKYLYRINKGRIEWRFREQKIRTWFLLDKPVEPSGDWQVVPKCHTCAGEGEVELQQCHICLGTGIEPEKPVCQCCNGTGRLIAGDYRAETVECHICKGTGKEPEKAEPPDEFPGYDLWRAVEGSGPNIQVIHPDGKRSMSLGLAQGHNRFGGYVYEEKGIKKICSHPVMFAATEGSLWTSTNQVGTEVRPIGVLMRKEK